MDALIFCKNSLACLQNSGVSVCMQILTVTWSQVMLEHIGYAVMYTTFLQDLTQPEPSTSTPVVLNLPNVWHLNTVPHTVLPSNQKIIFLLLCDYNFIIVTNWNVTIWYVTLVIIQPQRGQNPQTENHCSKCPAWCAVPRSSISLIPWGMTNCFLLSAIQKNQTPVWILR